MSCFFVCLNNWNGFDQRREGKRGWDCIRVQIGLMPEWRKAVNKSTTTLYTKELPFYFKTQATLSHHGCAMVNQEPLYLKVPSACLPVAYMRVFSRWSDISHSSSTMSNRTSPSSVRVWAIRSSLSTLTLHLRTSIPNDGLFLNRPWLLMSNPKIPSNTVFVLSYSRATSFHSCLPCFTLTGTACLLPDANGTDGGWRTRRSVNHNVKKNDALEKNSKREGCCHALWPSFSLSHTSASSNPPPLPFLC